LGTLYRAQGLSPISLTHRLTLTRVCRTNNACDEGQPPLGVKLTGYRLLNVAVMLAFGIAKAISSYSGGSAIPTTLDFVSGTFLAVV
jgi:hypothetical protein